jgi:hypothetical protein
MLYQIKCFLLKHQFFGVFTTTQLCALFQDVLQKAMLLVFTVTKILFKITKRKNWVFWALSFPSKETSYAQRQYYLHAHDNHQKPRRFTAVELKELLEKVRQLSPEELQVAAM